MKSKKDNKAIYLIVIGVLLITNILFISLFVNEKRNNLNANGNSAINNATRNKAKQVAGIYHTNNYQNKYEDTMTFNDDMTCKHSTSTAKCVWTFKDDKTIEYTMTWYRVMVNEENLSIMDLPTLEQCKNFIDGLKDSDYTNEHCEEYDGQPQEATIVNGGILINNTLYNKIG